MSKYTTTAKTALTTIERLKAIVHQYYHVNLQNELESLESSLFKMANGVPFDSEDEQMLYDTVLGCDTATTNLQTLGDLGRELEDLCQNLENLYNDEKKANFKLGSDAVKNNDDSDVMFRLEDV